MSEDRLESERLAKILMLKLKLGQKFYKHTPEKSNVTSKTMMKSAHWVNGLRLLGEGSVASLHACLFFHAAHHCIWGFWDAPSPEAHSIGHRSHCVYREVENLSAVVLKIEFYSTRQPCFKRRPNAQSRKSVQCLCLTVVFLPNVIESA